MEKQEGGIILFKTSLFLFCVILTSIFFCLPAYCFEGALLPPVQEELTSYNDEILQFTLRHPPSWKPVSQDHQNRHFLVFFSPIEGNDDHLQDNLSCSVENLDQPVTNDAYLKKSLDAFQNQITQLTIGNTFEVSIANQKALSVPFTGIYQNNQLAWVLTVLIKENQAYSFLLTSEPQKIENYWKQVSQMISSIRFQEKTSIPIFLAPSTPPEQPKKSLQIPTFSELQEKLSIPKTSVTPPKGKIVFASEKRGGDFAICVMNPDGNDIAPLTGNHHTLAWQPSWSPDGNKIVFTSFIDFHFEIFLMNADGSGEIMITGDTEEKVIRLGLRMEPESFFRPNLVFHPAPVLIFLVQLMIPRIAKSTLSMLMEATESTSATTPATMSNRPGHRMEPKLLSLPTGMEIMKYI